MDEKLAREEWDFSKVPDEDLEACMYYEYNRENSDFIRTFKHSVEELNKLHSKTTNKIKITLPASCDLIEKHGALLFLLRDTGFPIKPWQLLDKASQIKIKKFPYTFKTAQKKFFPPLKLEEVRDTNSLSKWKQKLKIKAAAPDESPNLMGCFEIDLSQGRKVLIKEFEELLDSFSVRPSRGELAGRPKNAFRIVLNQLGMLRLRYYCPTLRIGLGTIKKNRQKDAVFKSDNYISYSDRKSINRACESAVIFFQDLFDTAELPIRYTKGWQK